MVVGVATVNVFFSDARALLCPTPGAPHDPNRWAAPVRAERAQMAALAALYPAKLQKVASLDRFGHYRLETGEQLLVWTPIYPAGPLPLIIYLHGASSRGDDIQEIFEKGRAALQP